LTGGGVVTTGSNGEFIPPPLACTMTLPPICAREGQDGTPPALLELQRMFQFKQPSSSVRTCTSNYKRFCALKPRTPSGPVIHIIPPVVYRFRLPPDYTRRPLRRRNHKAKLGGKPVRGVCRGAPAAPLPACRRVVITPQSFLGQVLVPPVPSTLDSAMIRPPPPPFVKPIEKSKSKSTLL
jgi:hypothetical protein